MTWFEAVVYGVLQGLTEFLPISSSANLRIVGPYSPPGEILGYGVIVLFLRIVSTRTFMPFVVYRAALGLLVCGLLQIGLIEPLQAQ